MSTYKISKKFCKGYFSGSCQSVVPQGHLSAPARRTALCISPSLSARNFNLLGNRARSGLMKPCSTTPCHPLKYHTLYLIYGFHHYVRLSINPCPLLAFTPLQPCLATRKIRTFNNPLFHFKHKSTFCSAGNYLKNRVFNGWLGGVLRGRS